MSKIPAQDNPCANISSFEEYEKMYEFSMSNPDAFRSDLANRNLHFFEGFESVLNDTKYPVCKRFSWGKINLSYEAIDRHLKERGDQYALMYEREDGLITKITYNELSKNVNQSANLLKKMWVTKWDTIVFYMPQILESAYLMLACLRIGAIHSVVFGWFSAKSLADRIDDIKPKIIVTADWSQRKWESYPLKSVVDEALIIAEHSVEQLLLIENRGDDQRSKNNAHTLEVIYGQEIKKMDEWCDYELMDSNDTSFVLYTSWSTWKPKWIMHSTTWYALWSKVTCQRVFDMKPGDIFFSSADIGRITGHTYTLYWPLFNGATTILYEWHPLYPDVNKMREVIEKHQVKTFYTAPTLIRMLHENKETNTNKYDLSSLKIIGTVGEPIDADARKRLYEVVGKKKCAVVDTYRQTETWWHILAPLPFATDLKPRSATFPLPGIAWEVVDANGDVTDKWYFTITKPWPSMLMGIRWDKERYSKIYFSDIKRDGKWLYFSGDGSDRDEDGYIFITGRIDDVVNVSWHRIGTAEIENVLYDIDGIAECSVVGIPDVITGESLCAYLVLKQDIDEEKIKRAISLQVKKEIGAFAYIKTTMIVSELPKTRSGKIMRRLLRKIATGEEIMGDISALENWDTIKKLLITAKKLA